MTRLPPDSSDTWSAPTCTSRIACFISRVIVAMTFVAAPTPCLCAQDTVAATAEADLAFQKDATDLAVDRAVAYLISQQREDGAVLDKSHDTTMTALSIMAMASVGIQPSDPTPEGETMQKALAFVLRNDRVDDKGYFGSKDGSRMYGHGIVTLMLTEMLGMGTTVEQDLLIHERCQKAIDLILSSQKEKKSHPQSWRLAL